MMLFSYNNLELWKKAWLHSMFMLIFMFPDISYDSFYNEVGNPKEEYEKIYHYKNVIFWSFSRKDYQKTNWWSKTASSKISDRITIRTANTVRKIVKM